MIANWTVLFLYFFGNLYNEYVLNRNKRVPYTYSENNFTHCNRPFHASQKIRKQHHVNRKKITFQLKMQRLNHVLHKNTNSIHVSQNIQSPPFWCIEMPCACVTHRDRLDSRSSWFTVAVVSSQSRRMGRFYI